MLKNEKRQRDDNENTHDTGPVIILDSDSEVEEVSRVRVEKVPKQEVPKTTIVDSPPKSQEITKRNSNIMSYFSSTLKKSPKEFIIFKGRVVTDRKSRFEGFASIISSKEDAKLFKRQLLQQRPDVEKATHVIMARRLAKTRNGEQYAERDEASYDSDGEKLAGRKLYALLIEKNYYNVVVAVVRFYGGILLGPIRYSHIMETANDAIQKALHYQEMTLK